MPGIRKIQVAAGMMLAFTVSTAFAQQTIMATGDSITAGQQRPSYRKPLLDELSASGCTVDMVGDQTLNSFDYQAPAGTTGSHYPGFTPSLGYDTNHQAFGRIRARELLNGTSSSQYTIQPIAQYMQAEQPDFVLLHIGTNDLNGAIIEGTRTEQQINDWANETAAEVEQLIDSLLANHSNPVNLRILVANFIPYQGPFLAQDQIDAANRASVVYTSRLETLVENRADSRVLIVDVATGFDVASMTDDNVHPNELGEEHMAAAFLPVLFGAGLCPETVSTTPEIVSPAPGSELPGSTVSFDWQDNGTNATQWYFRIGSTVGGEQYASTRISNGAQRSAVFSGLPVDGSRVYVQFSYKPPSGSWVSTDLTYDAALLTGNNQAPFALADLVTGVEPGDTRFISVLENDTDPDGTIDSSTVTITAQPSEGAVVVLGRGRIRYTHNGRTTSGTDTFRYTVDDNDGATSNEALVTISPIQTGGTTLPELINPAPGGQLPGSDVTFEWAGNDTTVSQFYFRVGRSEGTSEFAEQRLTDPSTRQYTVRGLPADGSTMVHVEFSYFRNGRWTIRNFTYLAASSDT